MSEKSGNTLFSHPDAEQPRAVTAPAESAQWSHEVLFHEPTATVPEQRSA